VRGLIEKIVRESLGLVLAASLALFLVVTVLTLILPPMQSGIEQFTVQLPGLKGLLSGLLGVPVLNRLSAGMMLGVVWVDPVVLAVLWGFEVYFCTRFPAAEVDNGTIDILLSWPLSRTAIYLCETAFCLLWGVVLLLSCWLGFALGSLWLEAPNHFLAGRSGLVVLNLGAVYGAVAGLTFLLSSLSNRRARAMTVVLALLGASYLLNFVTQLWPPAAVLSRFSLLHYYQPGKILLSGRLEPMSLLVLVGFGLVCWLLGWWRVCRRDLCSS